MIRNVLHYLCLFFIVTPGMVTAQTIPMTVDIHQPAQFPKGDGPVSFVWQCSVSATGLLEGYFLVTAHDGHENFGQFRSNDVALHSGFHEIPMLLPPIKVDNPFSEVKLKLSFVTPKQRYDFKDEYSLRVGRVFQRTFAVGVCDPFDINFSPEMKEFLDKLKFESISPKEPVNVSIDRNIAELARFNPGIMGQNSLSLNVKTYSIHLQPFEFPQLPVDCHQYDILVITARGFDFLESRHLKAIHQWVRSGGSLCVIAGSILKQPQLQFLNSLVEGRSTSPFLIDSEGKLDLNLAEQILFQRTGWGRSVIILADALQNQLLTPEDKTQIPFFLWKLKASQKTYYDKEKQWDYHAMVKSFLELQKKTSYSNMNAYSVSEMLSLNYQPISTGGAVVTALMPAEMRIVPAWIIVSILLGYVLIIGPGEYFVLGKFKIRRFTWITFPLISIGFAFIVFLISDYYMQTSHERKILAIHDLDAQGRPVKENLIELLFTGSYQQIETKVRSGLLTPLNHTESGMTPNYNVYAQNISPSLVGPPFYSGSIPTQYSVFQLMPQWTPQLNRIIRNYPEDLKTGFDWASISVDELNSEEGREKLKEQIKTAFGDRALLLIYQGMPNGNVNKSMLFMSKNHGNNRVYYPNEYALVNPIHQHIQRYPGQQQVQHNFMDDLCVRNQTGIFQIVSQTSPSGGKNHEDLSILDASDPRQWLIVVYIPGEERDTIYRQFIVAEN